MKILHTVESYHPSVGGMQEVVKQLSERFVTLGHHVTVATRKLPERKDKFVNGVEIVEFDISGNLAWGINGDVEKYKNFLIQSDFDIITNFAAQQWATDIMLLVLDEIKAKKVFVPTGFSGLFKPIFMEYFTSMKTWLHQYDMNVFHSDNYQDITFARENQVTNITLIPNGASEDEFLSEVNIDLRKKFSIPKGHFIVLHVGSHTGVKGHSEAINIFRQAKIKDATLLIIANNFKKGCARRCRWKTTLFSISPKHLINRKRIINVSMSREETIAAFKEADLFLFPSNNECSPLVLFECMASHTPFLTTNVGNAAEIIEWSKGGLLLPSTKAKGSHLKAKIASSAKILEELYSDEEKRKGMQEAGFMAWQKRFTWEKITRNYEELYMNIIEGSQG